MPIFIYAKEMRGGLRQREGRREVIRKVVEAPKSLPSTSFRVWHGEVFELRDFRLIENKEV